MRITPLLIFSLTFFCSGAHAQSFFNGSLEGSAVPCNRVLNSQFPTFVGNAGYAFGTPDHGGYMGMIYFFDGSCGVGAPQKGSNFLGMAANDAGKVDALSLTLTAPLQANKTYTLTFYMRKSSTIPSIPLEIGYTTDSLNFGTLVRTVEAPSSTAWQLITVNLRPTVPTHFITLRAVKSNTGTFSYSYTYIDNFNITPGVGVTTEEKTFAMAPHPNPFKARLNLSLASDVRLPCQISLTDMTGRVVYSRKAYSTNVEIPRENIATGMYLLQIVGADGARGNSRVMAE